MNAKNPDHYAVVIGIDGYSWLPRLGAARTDAIKFAAWLLSERGGGLPAANIKLILSPEKSSSAPPDIRPIERDITGALEEVLREAIEKITYSKPPGRIGQRFYFYFAGHGVSPTSVDVGMLLADAKITVLGRNLGLAQCRQFFLDWGFFDEIVFILDCCRGMMQVTTPGLPFNLGDPPNPPRRVSDCIILAALPGQSAYAFAEDELTDDRRGVLTRALLEGLGLEGAPKALDPAGRVTALTLREYLKNRVPQIAAAHRLLQDPHISSDNDLIFLALTTDEVPTVTVRILAPAGVDGVLLVQEDRGPEIGRRPAREATAANPWEVTLRYGIRYLVQFDQSDAPPSILDPAKIKPESPLFKVPRPQ